MIIVVDEALELLRKYCPLSKPVVITEISKRKTIGLSRPGDSFEIEIAIDVDSVTQVETLVHEWAHCLRLNGRHDDSWGIEHARCYRATNTEEMI